MCVIYHLNSLTKAVLNSYNHQLKIGQKQDLVYNFCCNINSFQQMFQYTLTVAG